MVDPVRFPSTVWSMIGEARSGNPKALAEVFEGYRQPVLNFVRAGGLGEADAEDLTQEVFSILCREKFLRKVDARKGKFRSLVLAVTRNQLLLRRRHASARKRGGDATTVSADGLREAGFDVDAAVDQSGDLRDAGFDYCWIQNLVTRALQKLREESAAKGNRSFEALEAFIGGATYEIIGRRFGWEIDTVRSQIFQARAKLKKNVERLIMDYSADLDEYERELDYLWKLLGKSK